MTGRVAAPVPVPDFVVVDVETACSRVSSICQIGIVSFRDGVEVFEYETLVDPLDRFSSFNIRMGVRALLDCTFELAGAEPGADFGAKLRQLREAGVPGEGGLETMRVVTDAGSAAGHRGWRPTAEQLDTILDAAEALLHRVAVQPDRTDRLRQAVPPRPSRRHPPPS